MPYKDPLRTNELKRKLYHKRLNEKTCTKCRSVVLSTTNSCLCEPCRLKKNVINRSISKTARAKMKASILEKYGGVCQCCGERNPIFLSIDHINGKGRQHRQSVGLKSSAALYSWLKRNNFPKGFQVLCYNCNMGKYLNGGICPHKEAV